MYNSAQLRCFENGNDDFGVEAFWIGDAARVGYFVPLSGPLNGHPLSTNIQTEIQANKQAYRYIDLKTNKTYAAVNLVYCNVVDRDIILII